jgi:hypothetical protein
MNFPSPFTSPVRAAGVLGAAELVEGLLDVLLGPVVLSVPDVLLSPHAVNVKINKKASVSARIFFIWVYPP